jgi:cytochrome b pre-mRNA-processing protein 3
MLRTILQRFRPQDPSRSVYGQIVAQARRSVFYERLAVPDTVEGRFELIVLHLVIVLRRLRRDGPGGRRLAQGLVDTFFRDMEHSLREMGVSDVAIPKRMKEMIRAFYGRAGAYEAPLEAADRVALATVVKRNVLGGGSADGEASAIAGFAIGSERALAGQPVERLTSGELAWADVTATGRPEV